jgi:hypothetical protein
MNIFSFLFITKLFLPQTAVEKSHVPSERHFTVLVPLMVYPVSQEITALVDSPSVSIETLPPDGEFNDSQVTEK